jgi:hypothetical protein
VTGPQETFPLLLCGAPGTGKSSVAWEIYARLVRGGIAAATLDLDVVGYGPAPNNGSEAMKLTNLAAVAANYRAAGARCLVVSGVSATSEAVARCSQAVPGATATPCVLTVAPSEQQARLARRAQQEYSLGHGGAASTMTEESQAAFAAVAARALAAGTSLPEALVIDTTDKTVPAIADEILFASRWPTTP